MAQKMKLKQIIEELKAVRDSFNEVHDACPVCIYEAIRILEAVNNLKEV